MKPNHLLIRIGLSRTLAIFVAAGLLSVRQLALAATRTWNGGVSQNWSDGGNWSPVGAPQNGEDLVFNNPPGATLIDDIIGLSVKSLGFNHSCTLEGTNLTVTSDITAYSVDAAPVVLGSPSVNDPFVLVLGGNVEISTSDTNGTGLTIYCQVNLNGHDLEVIGPYKTSSVRIYNRVFSYVHAPANIYFLGGTNVMANHGVDPNYLFSGSIIVNEGNLSLPSGYQPAIPSNLFIQYGATVSAKDDNVITNAATVQIYEGGYFLLNGHVATIYNLVMTNLASDTIPCTVDAGSSGTLGINGSIRTYNDSWNVTPTIAGGLACNGPATPISTSGAGARGLLVSAQIFGDGFAKTGLADMILAGTNQFTGRAEVDEGNLVVNSTGAFAASSGVLLADAGVLELWTSVFGVPLDVQGTRLDSLFGSTYGSSLYSYDSPLRNVWGGPITLHTNLIVKGDDVSLSGAISGAGGLAFEATGSSSLSCSSGNTYTGTTRVRQGALYLDTPQFVPAVGNDLVIGPASSSSPATVLFDDSQVLGGNTVTVNANSTLNLRTSAQTLSQLNLNDGGSVTGSGFLDMAGGSTVSVGSLNPSGSHVSSSIAGNIALPANDNPVTFYVNPYAISFPFDFRPELDVPANISGFNDSCCAPTTLIKAGLGQMRLEGNSTFTGPVNINQGILIVAGNRALGATNGTTVIAGGATLRLIGGNIGENVEMAGAGVGGVHGAIEVVSNSLFQLTGNLGLDAATTIKIDPGSELRLFGSIFTEPAGSGALTFTGGGIATLEGNSPNTYSGDTIVQQGSLWLGKSDGISAVPGTLYVGDGSGPAQAFNLGNYQIVGAIVVNDGCSYDTYGYQENTDFLALYGNAAVSTESGYLSLKTGADVYVYPPGGASITGTVEMDPGIHHFNVASNATFAVNARLAQYSSTASIEKTGPGILSLSSNNTFLGDVYASGGTLIAGNPGALGAGSGTTWVSNSAALVLQGGYSFNLQTLVLNSSNPAALQSQNGSNTWSGPIGLYQPTCISVDQSGYLQVLNTVSGAGGLTKSGPGRLQFWGYVDNTYSGGTTVAAGILEAGRVNRVSVPGDVIVGDDTTSTTTATLQIDREQQFSAGANVTVHRSGQLYLNSVPTLGTPAPSVGTLSGSGPVVLGAGSLTVSNNTFCSFGGAISGPGALTKNGTGTLQLTATNTYAGNTTNSAGTLQVDGYQYNSTIQNFARLQGSGTVGIINMNSSTAVLAPGGSPGILTSGNLNGGTPGAHGSLEIELNGTMPGTGYDQLRVEGSVELSNITLNASLNFTASLSNSFTIIRNDGSKQVFGTFTGLPEGASLNIGSRSFRISYTGGDGDDVVLTEVLPTLTVTAIPSGVVLKSPDLSSYPYDSTVMLIAVPPVGYAFTGWSGDATGTQNPLSVTMSTSKVITASFASTVSDLIVDNTNATFTGSWTIDSGSVGSAFFAQDFRYTTTFSSSSATAVFRPNLPLTGNYDVYVWSPRMNQTSKRCSDAELVISSPAGGTNTASVNQGGPGSFNSWVSIASSQAFSQGTNGFVQLSNQSTDVNRFVGADAVRWVWSSNQVSQPYITSVAMTGTNATLTWLSGSNYVYRLQYKNRLSDPTWLAVSSDVTATSVLASKTDTNLASAASRFYRVELLP